MRTHANAHYRQLGHGGVAGNHSARQTCGGDGATHYGTTGHRATGHGRSHRCQRRRVIIAMHGEGEVHAPLARGIQHNHVDFDVRRANRLKHSESGTRPVRQTGDSDGSFIPIESNAGDQGSFHGSVLCCDERAFTILEAERDAQLHVVLGRKLHRTQVQHARTLPSQFQHFLERQPWQTACRRHHTRVRGVDAIHIGKDLAFVRTERHGHSDGGGIGATAPDGGDIAGRVDALKTRDDRYRPFCNDGREALPVDPFDARLAMHGGGAHRHLKAHQGTRRNTGIMQCHRQ